MLAVSVTPWPLYLQETNPVLILQEAGWASGLFWVAPNILPPPAFEHKSTQPIVSDYADLAILATFEQEQDL